MIGLKFYANLLELDDETWRRLTNPMSVYIRFSFLPLISLALWTRIIWGWKFSLILCGLDFVVAVVGPRILQRPTDTKHSWASKTIIGERMWMNKKIVPIPHHHHKFTKKLNVIAWIGLWFLLLGSLTFRFWMIMFGLFTHVLARMWFMDRMVWICEDMKEANQIYRSWVY